jgi:hypothetical protein
LATNKRRGIENIDASQIQPADDIRDRRRIQARIWENNETLAAAHCRSYQQYLSRYGSQMQARPKLVQGIIHHGSSALVLIATNDGLELRRVQNDVQETIALGEEATKAFQTSLR